MTLRVQAAHRPAPRGKKVLQPPWFWVPSHRQFRPCCHRACMQGQISRYARPPRISCLQTFLVFAGVLHQPLTFSGVGLESISIRRACRRSSARHSTMLGSWAAKRHTGKAEFRDQVAGGAPWRQNFQGRCSGACTNLQHNVL